MGRKVWFRNKGETLLEVVIKFFVFKSLLTTPGNVLPLHPKQIFPPIIWIFTKGKGDGIEFRLPFKIFSTYIRNILKFGFSEKATKFEKKIFVVLLTKASCSGLATVYLSKSRRRFFKQMWTSRIIQTLTRSIEKSPYFWSHLQY
jgi:hypothetical protein